MEWVKASFDCLNKLFIIFSDEKNHQTLLMDWNLLVVVSKPQLYVLPIIYCSLPKVLVPREHHMLKDLSFYEVAREANAKARQDRLDQREN